MSKRGILDEGIYLTDNGLDTIKKIKIKPAPARRPRPIKSLSNEMDVDSQRIDKNDDEASRSSSEDKADAMNDENTFGTQMTEAKNMLDKKPNQPKRQVLIGNLILMILRI